MNAVCRLQDLRARSGRVVAFSEESAIESEVMTRRDWMIL
jgi:hypothetical protein